MAVLPVSASYAATITLFANLTGAAEVPPNNSPGTGQATVVLDTFNHLMHCCLSFPFAAANVMVATTTPTFPGFPSGVTSGTYSNDFNLLIRAGKFGESWQFPAPSPARDFRVW
jgi:hypothetical protein